MEKTGPKVCAMFLLTGSCWILSNEIRENCITKTWTLRFPHSSPMRCSLRKKLQIQKISKLRQNLHQFWQQFRETCYQMKLPVDMNDYSFFCRNWWAYCQSHHDILICQCFLYLRVFWTSSVLSSLASVQIWLKVPGGQVLIGWFSQFLPKGNFKCCFACFDSPLNILHFVISPSQNKDVQTFFSHLSHSTQRASKRDGLPWMTGDSCTSRTLW